MPADFILNALNQSSLSIRYCINFRKPKIAKPSSQKISKKYKSKKSQEKSVEKSEHGFFLDDENINDGFIHEESIDQEESEEQAESESEWIFPGVSMDRIEDKIKEATDELEKLLISKINKIEDIVNNKIALDIKQCT